MKPKKRRPKKPTRDCYNYDKFHRLWRPAMAWMYMVICIFDFLLAPIIFMAYLKNPAVWNPLTLQGGGLFHLSMGAIVGFTVWGRSQEKIKTAELEFETTTTSGPQPPGPPVIIQQAEQLNNKAG